MNYWETIILFFSFQAILLSLFFFFRTKGEQHDNRVMAFFLLCFGYCIGYNVLFWSRLLFTPTFIHLNHSYLIPQGLLAPLFYLYVRGVIDRTKVSWSKDLWHFLPAILTLISFFPYYIQSLESKMTILQQGNIREIVFMPIPLGFSLSLIMLVYVAYIFTTYLKKYKEDLDIKIWLMTISGSFLACAISYLLYYLLNYSGVLETHHDYLITAFMALSVLIVSFFSFNQPEVFNGQPIEQLAPIFKYKKTGVSKNQSIELKQKLVDLMDREQPYLKSDLRLDELANMLGIPRHHTSQVINEHFDQNFNDFVNNYRIRFAIQLLEQENSPYHIKEIAYQSGFNNYVSFYKSFKKITGQLPKEYRKAKIS